MKTKFRLFILMGLIMIQPCLSSFSQVSINTNGDPPDNSAMLEISSSSRGLLMPRMTQNQIEAIYDPADGLQVYCTTDGILYIFVANDNSWKEIAFGDRELFPPLPYSIGTGGSCANTAVNGIYVTDTPLNSVNYVTIQVNVSVPGPYEITTSQVNGYSFSASGNFTNLGLQNVNLVGSGTPVNSGYDHFYATASAGGGTCQFSISVISWTCGMPVSINHLASGGVAPVGKLVTYGTTTNIPGETSRCWITQNLGADYQATTIDDATEASSGWYWQFNLKQGYKHDGTTRTPNTIWITSISESFDWQAANDPCSLLLWNGWRIPTSTELTNIDASGNWTDWNGPWNSSLKIHGAGCLAGFNGNYLLARGAYGYYGSSTQSSPTAGWVLFFGNSQSEVFSLSKIEGRSIRCIK